jgi:hypothetical protein
MLKPVHKSLFSLSLCPLFADPQFAVYGAPYYLCHRADIHAGLLDAALKAGADIRTKSAVVKYDFETPSVTLENGSVIKGDIVIAADGTLLVGLPWPWVGYLTSSCSSTRHQVSGSRQRPRQGRKRR